jgi:hypothetical protein
MKRVMFAMVIAGALAVTSGWAQQPQTPAQPAEPQGTAGQQQQTMQQPRAGQAGATSLGSVRIPRAVTADGKPLPRGTYQVRLTAEEAKPDVVGQDAKLSRWVEFVQGGQVRGREVVSIVPQAEIAQVAEGRAPATGASRVELLKGNDYLRVWINRGGNHYLIHLPTGA